MNRSDFCKTSIPGSNPGGASILCNNLQAQLGTGRRNFLHVAPLLVMPATERRRSLRALVVLPTLNEAKNLPLLVPRILEHERFRLLIVDDRSTDGTGDVADALAARYPGRIEVMHRTGTGS